jgi:hypothetical protein
LPPPLLLRTDHDEIHEDDERTEYQQGYETATAASGLGFKLHVPKAFR